MTTSMQASCKVVFGLILLGGSGCTTMLPRGSVLGRPEPAVRRIDRKLWLHRMEIPGVHVAANSLNGNYKRFLVAGGYFREVVLTPGKVRPGDLSLVVTLNRYERQRSPYLPGIPLSMVTLTFYIWFNGPLMIDISDYAGTAVVRDSVGVTVAEASFHLKEKHSVGYWSPDRLLPSGAEARTAFFNGLTQEIGARIRAWEEETSK